MDSENYSKKLIGILRNYSKQAILTLSAADQCLSENVSAIDFGIHPNQEPDGMFSILIHLQGRDLYVLNKAIENHRYLFDVKFIDGELTPKVPLFDPFNTDFDVNDVIVDTALLWIEEVWMAFDGKMKKLPSQVFGAEGYGTNTPKQLRNRN